MDEKDKISSAKAEKIYQSLIHHEDTRQYFLKLMCEYADSVPFMKKVKEYAGEEMDKRVFRSFKYWGGVVGTAIVTSGIGVLLTYLFTKK
ncbi:MAG: hypothetical protein AAB870_04255 [Patescibacteria group bacterium]